MAKIIGIDISDKSIKIVEARTKKNEVLVLNYNYTKLKKDIIQNGEIKDEKSLSLIIHDLLEKATPGPMKSTDVCLGIPDYLIFNLFEPKVEAKDDSGQLDEIVFNNIPIESNDVFYTNKNETFFGNKSKKKYYKYTVEATYKSLIMKWGNFFKKNNLNLVQIISNTSAANYAIDEISKKQSACIVDIGEKYTNINIISENDVVYSYSSNNAGFLITEDISKIKISADAKTIPWPEAEKLKKAFNPNINDEKGVNNVVGKYIKEICQNIQSTIELCAKNKNICVNNIYIIGGGAKINSITALFQKYFDSSNIKIECIKNKTVIEKVSEKEKKKQILEKTQVDKVYVRHSTSSILQQKNLDLLFLQAVGICNAYINTGPLIFSKNKIKNILKKEQADIKQRINKEEKEEKEKKGSWVKENKKLVQLIIVILLGVMLLPLAIWYRKNNQKKQGELYQNAEYSVEKKITIKPQLIFNETEYQPGVLMSRVVEVTIEESVKYDEALDLAIEKANSLVNKNEKIWPEIINDIEEDNVIFPLNFEFISYNENDVSALAMNEGKERYGTNEFILSGLEIISLDKKSTDYFLEIEINYLVNPGIEDKKVSENLEDTQDQNNPEENTETNEEKETSTDMNKEEANENIDENFNADFLKQLLEQANQNKFDNYITILDTGVGYLNVRTGPGKDYDLIEQVYPGEVYELIDEENSWSKININGLEEAWVNDDYVEKTKK
ncbi:hypothetical protein C0583_04955 [Candidatus Parcubacteria bacterium]|nr:MAG: hypothetical protein C0583_04955 [Candidatus Parcubacteria bacterium]